MANELRFNNGFEVVQSDLLNEWPRREILVDVAGTNHIRHQQTLTDQGQEALVVGETIVGGYAVFANRSTTTGEDITIYAGAQAFCVLKPGEEARLRLSAGQSYTADATAGLPLLDFWLLED